MQQLRSAPSSVLGPARHAACSHRTHRSRSRAASRVPGYAGACGEADAVPMQREVCARSDACPQPFRLRSARRPERGHDNAAAARGCVPAGGKPRRSLAELAPPRLNITRSFSRQVLTHLVRFAARSWRYVLRPRPAQPRALTRATRSAFPAAFGTREVGALAASLPAREHIHPRPPALARERVTRRLASPALLARAPLPPPPPGGSLL